jgi:hypothetical protein
MLARIGKVAGFGPDSEFGLLDNLEIGSDFIKQLPIAAANFFGLILIGVGPRKKIGDPNASRARFIPDSGQQSTSAIAKLQTLAFIIG